MYFPFADKNCDKHRDGDDGRDGREKFSRVIFEYKKQLRILLKAVAN